MWKDKTDFDYTNISSFGLEPQKFAWVLMLVTWQTLLERIALNRDETLRDQPRTQSSRNGECSFGRSFRNLLRQFDRAPPGAEVCSLPAAGLQVFNRLVGPNFALLREVILSGGRAIPTIRLNQLPLVFNDLRTADGLLYVRADEVARNGVLQRITSARGFL